MAYPNYYPATYQNPYQQSFFQQLQPTQPVQTGIIWVNSEEEAIAYPIAPNNAVRLWHSTKPIVYFKTADASGKPSIKAYDLVERSQAAQNSVMTDESKVTEYATKSEFDALAAAVEAIKTEMKHKRRREVEEDE